MITVQTGGRAEERFFFCHTYVVRRNNVRDREHFGGKDLAQLAEERVGFATMRVVRLEEEVTVAKVWAEKKVSISRSEKEKCFR